MKKIIAFLLVMVMICSILTGCGAKETITINIKLPILTLPAVNDPECTETSYFMQKAFDSFAAQYDKYNVSVDI